MWLFNGVTTREQFPLKGKHASAFLWLWQRCKTAFDEVGQNLIFLFFFCQAADCSDYYQLMMNTLYSAPSNSHWVADWWMLCLTCTFKYSKLKYIPSEHSLKMTAIEEFPFEKLNRTFRNTIQVWHILLNSLRFVNEGIQYSFSKIFMHDYHWPIYPALVLYMLNDSLHF